MDGQPLGIGGQSRSSAAEDVGKNDTSSEKAPTKTTTLSVLQMLELWQGDSKSEQIIRPMEDKNAKTNVLKGKDKKAKKDAKKEMKQNSKQERKTLDGVKDKITRINFAHGDVFFAGNASEAKAKIRQNVLIASGNDFIDKMYPNCTRIVKAEVVKTES